MTQITLTDEQVVALRQANDAVVFCDRHGRPLSGLRKLPITPQRLAELEQRLDHQRPWKSTAEVLAELRASEAP